MHFLGARRDLGNILSAIDIFAMPSYWEGLPLSMVLAMGAGLPVVASRVAGIPEVVKDGVSGVLVDAGDSASTGARARDARATTVHFVRGSAPRRRRSCCRALGSTATSPRSTTLYDRLLAAKGMS